MGVETMFHRFCQCRFVLIMVSEAMDTMARCLFCFGLEITFLGKFDIKTQNCQFRLKFGTSATSNMQDSMVMFNFSVFDWKHPFWANLVQKLFK